MNPHSFTSAFLAARAKTAITVMNATGWQQGVINPQLVGTDSVFFYVLDHQTKWIWACSISKDAFRESVRVALGLDHDQAIAACRHLIASAAVEAPLNNDQSTDLAFALTAYLCKTQTFQLAQGGAAASHFAVIHYNASGSIRPFAMNGPASYFLEAGAVTSAMKTVVAMDAANHPEWMESFRSA